jgi:hypothetical protein
MKKIQLLLAENHPLVLQGCARLVSDKHQIVGTVADGRAASPLQRNSRMCFGYSAAHARTVSTRSIGATRRSLSRYGMSDIPLSRR